MGKLSGVQLTTGNQLMYISHVWIVKIDHKSYLEFIRN